MEFDPIQSRMLSMDALPSLQKTFAYVQNEESRCSTMLLAASSDRSALVSTPSEKDTLFCDFFRRPRHTRETCWKLHGQPSGGRGDRSSSRGGR